MTAQARAGAQGRAEICSLHVPACGTLLVPGTRWEQIVALPRVPAPCCHCPVILTLPACPTPRHHSLPTHSTISSAWPGVSCPWASWAGHHADPTCTLHSASPAVGVGQMGQGAQAEGLGLVLAATLATAAEMSHHHQGCQEAESSSHTAPAPQHTQGQWDWLHTPWLGVAHIPGPGGAQGPTASQIQSLGSPDLATVCPLLL